MPTFVLGADQDVGGARHGRDVAGVERPRGPGRGAEERAGERGAAVVPHPPGVAAVQRRLDVAPLPVRHRVVREVVPVEPAWGQGKSERAPQNAGLEKETRQISRKHVKKVRKAANVSKFPTFPGDPGERGPRAPSRSMHCRCMHAVGMNRLKAAKSVERTRAAPGAVVAAFARGGPRRPAPRRDVGADGPRGADHEGLCDGVRHDVDRPADVQMVEREAIPSRAVGAGPGRAAVPATGTRTRRKRQGDPDAVWPSKVRLWSRTTKGGRHVRAQAVVAPKGCWNPAVPPEITCLKGMVRDAHCHHVARVSINNHGHVYRQCMPVHIR